VVARLPGDAVPGNLAGGTHAAHPAMRRLLPVALTLVAATTPHATSRSDAKPAPVDTTIVSFETREGTRLAFDVSPRDGTIAFDLLGQLWIVPPTGGEARAITDAVADTAEDLDPTFAPDGRRLVFQSDRPKGRSLWMTDDRGTVPMRVTAMRIPYYARAEPAWSPDGRRFVFARAGGLVVHDLETGTDSVVRIDGVPNVAASSPSWSPDGQTIAFVNGGRRPAVLQVGVGGGRAERLTDSTIGPEIASFSRSGKSLALIARDSLGRAQVWVQPIGQQARRLTSDADVARHRVRWSPDDRFIIYSAQGRLWRVAADGGTPVEIPFLARVRFVRHTSPIHEVTLPAPGRPQRARGFNGLALSPDGSRIAMLALDSLWVWKPGGVPRTVPVSARSAYDLAWSPDSRHVVWSAGTADREDLFVVDVRTAERRRLTALPGSETSPVWSPDGARIAFMHTRGGGPAGPSHLRVVSVDAGRPVTGLPADDQRSDLRDLGPIDGLWMREQGAVWTPDGRSIVTYANALLSDDVYPARFRLVPLDGAARDFPARLTAPSFGTWFGRDFTYVEGDRLWRVAMTPEAGVAGEPRALGDDAALAASAARDGSVLYLSEDGLRLRRPGGRVERLGWPVTFRAAVAPPPMLLRNVRLIDGSGRGDMPARDVLLQEGRIARIAAPGELRPPNDVTVLDAAGRFAMPGLIDMHAHFFPETQPAALLYNGVTSARDVGSSAARTAALRDAVDAGLTSGPRITLGGFLFHSRSDAPNGASGFMDQELSDSAQLDRALGLASALGAGYIKHRTFEDWGGGVRTIAAAHRRGFPISGHCAHILPIVAAGMDGKEHSGDCFRDFGRIYEDFTRLYAAAGLWVDPTVGLYAPIARAAADSTVLDSPSIAPWLVESMRRRYLTGQPVASLERSLGIARSRTAALKAAGLPLIAGTDQGLGDGIHWELEELVHAGLSPAEAITAATSRAASVLGASGEIGTLEVGKRADVVILDANPLADIANTRRIWRVVQGGRTIDRDALVRAAPNTIARSTTDAAGSAPRSPVR
jgi:Tol biopolymer transport system component